MMLRKNPEAYARVTSAIELAERKTSGEIVVVVADRSATYGGYRAGTAALLMIALALGLWLFVPSLPPGWILAAQPVVFLALFAIMGLRPVLRQIVPSDRIDLEVDRMAKAAFVDRGVHRTKERAGVLLFVSLLEHRVCILGDEGIHRIVGADGWSRQLSGLTDDLREARRDSQRIDGLVRAVTSIGDLLAMHFPAAPGAQHNENELPDDVKRA